MKNIYSILRVSAQRSMGRYIAALVLLPLMLCGTSACTDLLSLDEEYGGHYPSGRHYPYGNERREPPVLNGSGHIQAAFAPWDDVEEVMVKAVDKAREQILVQAYVISNKQIVDALIRAHARKVDVRVLADSTQMHKRVSRVRELARAGIAVRLETRYKSAHNKLMIIDPNSIIDATLITGSMNYSDTSPRANAENILIIGGAGFYRLMQEYADNWQRHAKDATLYTMPQRKGIENPIIAVPIPILVPTPATPRTPPDSSYSFPKPW